MTNQSGCLPRYEDMTETRGKYGERRERTHLGTTCPIIRNGPLEQTISDFFQTEYIILINIFKPSYEGGGC